MNTVHSSTAESVTSISEASIRTHLTSINRKLASLGLPEIPINTADWILHQDDRYIHADSIGSYITELSLAIDTENDHREKERTLLEAELASIAKQLRTLRESYKHGGYKQNHEMMNALLQDLRKRGEKSPKIKDLRAQLAPLEKIDKEGNMLQISIDTCDTHLSGIKIRLQKSLKKIPDTFIDEIEKNLKKIRIKQMKVIHIEEPEKQKSKKKPTFGLSRKTAAAAVVILGASIVGYNMMPEKEQKKPTPWTSAKNPTYPPFSPRPGEKIVVIKPPVNSIEGRVLLPQQSEEMVQDRKEAIVALKTKIDDVLKSGSPETLYQTMNSFKYGKYLFTNFHITTQVHMGDTTRTPQNNYYAEFQCDIVDTKSGTKMRLIPTQTRALNLDDLLASHISFPEELDGSQITEENIARYQSKLGGDIDRQVSTLLGKYGYIKEGITSLALRPTEDDLNTVNMIVVIDPNIIITRPLHVSGHLDYTVLSNHVGRDMSTGIGKKIAGVTGKNLADQINTKFTNFINDPRNLEKNICRLYLDNIIASLGRDIQQSTRSIKSAKFIGSKSEKIDNKLIFTISYCSLVDSQGDLLVEDSSTRFDITNRFPRPNWIEKDLFQDPEKKKNFEEQLLEQCKIRFPRNNIFDLDIRGAEITGQINDADGISHITLAFMTNLGPILLKQNSSYKEEPIRQ